MFQPDDPIILTKTRFVSGRNVPPDTSGTILEESEHSFPVRAWKVRLENGQVTTLWASEMKKI